MPDNTEPILSEQGLASLRKTLLVDRYPLPGDLRPEGEKPPHQRPTEVQHLLDNIRHQYPTPSEMRRREAARPRGGRS